MKQCPRCKSQMVKTHGEKFLCKACGYVTVILS
jgi:ribosomal protein S27AE